jgi:CrcB protein
MRKKWHSRGGAGKRAIGIDAIAAARWKINDAAILNVIHTGDANIMGEWVQFWIQLNITLGDVMEFSLEGVRMLQPLIKKISIVMLGGSFGAASRYVIGLLAAKAGGAQFPWGTLTVNLIGCFLIGLIFALSDRVRMLTPDMRMLIITGYLGALTTFSSFSLETVAAARAGLTLQPFLNILINNLGGLALTFIGLWLGSLK